LNKCSLLINKRWCECLGQSISIKPQTLKIRTKIEVWCPREGSSSSWQQTSWDWLDHTLLSFSTSSASLCLSESLNEEHLIPFSKE
jgi:hypothetical protein